MKRQDKYPDTATFHFYNANPKNRITGDCWLRAICTGLEMPYETVLREMVEVQIKTGYEMGCEKCVTKYLESKGWCRRNQPRKYDNTKYTGSEFCERIAKKEKRYILDIGSHHMVAVVDNKVNDIWDSTNGAVGIYWEKI